MTVFPLDAQNSDRGESTGQLFSPDVEYLSTNIPLKLLGLLID